MTLRGETIDRAAAGDPDARRLELVVAMDRNGAIGHRNALPWRLPADLKRFRLLTTGHSIVMGRRTWESIGRPLPDRQSIVLSRRADFVASGAQVARTLDEALALARLPDPVFCIGGAEIFALALPRASRIHVTRIDAEFPGDTFFPVWDTAQWRETARETHAPGDGVAFDYAFITYDRVPAAR
jgi:dihydrofolate reductase